MKVLFAPDWRQGVPYQSLLAKALMDEGVTVVFPSGRRRALPLYRMAQDEPSDILHLHWPEAYWPPEAPVNPCWRRYPIDLFLTSLQQPIVLTAHNLWPHNCLLNSPVRKMVRTTMCLAKKVIAHSQAARDILCELFPIDPANCVVIPHGDLSPALGSPVEKSEARKKLRLDPIRPIVLLFGRVESYKGIEDLVKWWLQEKPEAQLVILGQEGDPITGQWLRTHCQDEDTISLHLRRIPDRELATWLSAADACVFNYLRIFTSGAASLARSWGLPLLLPSHLTTVELGEPTPLVRRFHSLNSDFGLALNQILSIKSSFDAAQSWRDSISWKSIAEKTIRIYS